MATLEDLIRGATVKGILPNCAVTVIDVKWHGSDVVELTYKDANGQPHTQLLLREDEASLAVMTDGQPWNFGGDGALLRLVSEAQRIRLAHLFDPLLAVHTSLVEPLPHQITAVYNEMLTRQPLRFLLADDPGAGKTIMAGLFIRELLIRGDLQRCLIVCPGSLVVQWQDELFHKFHLPFEILTNDRIEAARTGNAFVEMPLVIARLDKLSRDKDLQAKLGQTDWDLVVVDEAHKLSASFFGGEVQETKRYKLGKLLSTLTRHFLLMTATPHNGKEEDFQLFLALLDGDRFEGRFRDGVHTCDVSDLMRRLVKEDLLKFDGKPLFPERRAHTVKYVLSDLEAVLYKQVTDYVREEFNRAEALANDGRKGTVGFALTILQRRLASSPEAIYQSLRRRRERLENRLREEELLKRGLAAEIDFGPTIDPDDWDDDFEDSASDEREYQEEELIDQATAARTIAELQAEIHQLLKLEDLALQVRRSGKDRKWEELSKLLQNGAEMFDAGGHRRKLVIFTEHRDTLNYLVNQITTLLGRPEAVVTIHGSMGREERKRAEEAFKQDVTVQVLVATDAAGEGINLQRAHLMVNYDLPWNPNRLEQRFGRIHRIGQTEVCHLWNLVAEETREGDVYLALLKKLEIEQKALGGQVFDVLGKAIAGKELRELLIEAIRYGDRPEVKARLNQVVADRLNQARLRELLEERALARDSMDVTKVQQIRQEMERAEARKLQPHFIAAFFLEAFQRLGGTIRQREPKRYEITHVPAVIRDRDRLIGVGEAILKRYERICFEKELISVPGKPLATFVCPGHPLLDVTVDLILERHRDLLRQGAILVDENDPGEAVRVLVYLEHSIQDARTGRDGRQRVVSRRMQYVEILEPQRHGDIEIRSGGYAPYLDYRPLTPDENIFLETQYPLRPLCLRGADLESQATTYAITNLVPQHLQEVRERKAELIDKTMRAVKDRLPTEINYWVQRAAELRLQEQAGKPNAKLNSARAQQRADELAARLQKRLDELEQERKLSALPPVVIGGALVVPIGLLQRLQGKREATTDMFAQETKRVERAAMAAVMAVERALGYEPRD
ncbi:MAG: helicase-related protein, partial [Cyanobacteriota bacterium SKYGB_h_bin112]|nr:helicase-related protein [Cyanobacteriota bacterium SKYGB_h_bin112]